MFNLVFYHHHFTVEHVVKAHKIVGLEASPAKETVSNPHYRNITHLYIDNNPQCESRKTKQLSTACPNNHSEQFEDEEDYAIPAIDTIPMETKDKTNKVLLGNEMYEECIQLNQNVAYSPSRVWSKKQDLSAADQESNPLSHNEVVKGVQNQNKVDTTKQAPSSRNGGAALLP